MNSRDATIKDLRELEERLLVTSVRRSPEQLNFLLADDFIEIGASGRVYDKAAIIEDLQQETPAREKLTVCDFHVRMLSGELAQATYTITESNTRRSSIWRRRGNGWEIVFHQGTPIAQG